MNVSIVILVVLALVAIVLAWRLRRASVERVVPPWEGARHGPMGVPTQAEADHVRPIVHDASGGEISPSAPNDRPPARDAIVTVLATHDYAELLVAKSLLEGAEIPYYAKGEMVQNLLGGHLWGGPNVAMGFVEIQVPAAFEEEARMLLENPEPLDE